MAGEIDPAFLKALFGEDELGVVVRAHIHIEAGLRQFIDVVTPFPKLLPNLRYEQRVCLACALGLAKEYGPPLRKLGNIRNKFGHHVDTRLTADMVRVLFDTFSPEDRQIIVESHARTRAQVQPDADAPAEFTQLSPKSQFILIATALKRMLEQEKDDAEKQKAA